MNALLILWFLYGAAAVFIGHMGMRRIIAPHNMVTLWEPGFERNTAWITHGLMLLVIGVIGPIGLIMIVVEERVMLKEWWDGEF